MSEVHFYHLQGTTLERVLPPLLDRCLARGWRATVQTATEERAAALDDSLWTYADTSFLPHGSARDGDPAAQPIFLTAAPDNLNGAAVRVFVEQVDILPVLERPDARYERSLVVFDGNDADALTDARRQWALLRAAGHAVTYWRQTEDGRWEKKA